MTMSKDGGWLQVQE